MIRSRSTRSPPSPVAPVRHGQGPVPVSSPRFRSLPVRQTPPLHYRPRADSDMTTPKRTPPESSPRRLRGRTRAQRTPQARSLLRAPMPQPGSALRSSPKASKATRRVFTAASRKTERNPPASGVIAAGSAWAQRAVAEVSRSLVGLSKASRIAGLQLGALEADPNNGLVLAAVESLSVRRIAPAVNWDSRTWEVDRAARKRSSDNADVLVVSKCAFPPAGRSRGRHLCESRHLLSQAPANFARAFGRYSRRSWWRRAVSHMAKHPPILAVTCECQLPLSKCRECRSECVRRS